MNNNRPKPKEYYDWEDIKSYFDFEDIYDVFNEYEIDGNGVLVTIFDDKLKRSKRYKNRKKILEEFGECKIYVWW